MKSLKIGIVLCGAIVLNGCQVGTSTSQMPNTASSVSLIEKSGVSAEYITTSPLLYKGDIGVPIAEISFRGGTFEEHLKSITLVGDLSADFSRIGLLDDQGHILKVLNQEDIQDVLRIDLGSFNLPANALKRISIHVDAKTTGSYHLGITAWETDRGETVPI